MGIRNGKHIIEQIGETVSHWKDYAKEGGVKETHSQVINDNLLLLAPKTIAIHKPMNEKDKGIVSLPYLIFISYYQEQHSTYRIHTDIQLHFYKPDTLLFQK